MPLVVDLDGTLVTTDLLHETFFDAIASHGFKLLHRDLFANLTRQGLKSRLADCAEIDYSTLPYNKLVLQLIADARHQGRPVYLATASDRRHAEGVAAHLGVFDGIFASDQTVNLRGRRKAEALVAAFGEGGFQYVGNHPQDFEIWRVSRQPVSIGLGRRHEAALKRLDPQHSRIEQRRFDFSALIKVMRTHQYAKNLLLFVPLFTAHQFTAAALGQAVIAFVAFSLCASSVYVLNDMLDIQADRAHPTKKRRPFAAGTLSIAWGLVLAPVLLAIAFALSILLPWQFTAILLGYFALTTAYSFSLKRKMVVDIVVLAILYTARIVAGSAAVGVVPSEWLLAFSLLLFTALALVKRYIELSARLDKGLEDPTNRNYKKTDLPVIASLAAAAGMNSITIFALYVSSDSVVQLYNRPFLLWALCPLFLYWISRVLMLAHRRMMDDDPITFALKDFRSWIVGGASVAIVIAAL